MILVLGLDDDLREMDDTGGSGNRTILWRPVALAYLTSVVASATFIGVLALAEHLDRTIG
jgi:hypothetical protein